MVVVTYNALPWIEQCLASLPERRDRRRRPRLERRHGRIRARALPGGDGGRAGEPRPRLRLEHRRRADARRVRAAAERRRLARSGLARRARRNSPTRTRRPRSSARVCAIRTARCSARCAAFRRCGGWRPSTSSCASSRRGRERSTRSMRAASTTTRCARPSSSWAQSCSCGARRSTRSGPPTRASSSSARRPTGLPLRARGLEGAVLPRRGRDARLGASHGGRHLPREGARAPPLPREAPRRRRTPSGRGACCARAAAARLVFRGERGRTYRERRRGSLGVRSCSRDARMAAPLLLLSLLLLGIARLLPEHGFGLWLRLAAASLVLVLPGTAARAGARPSRSGRGVRLVGRARGGRACDHLRRPRLARPDARPRARGGCGRPAVLVRGRSAVGGAARPRPRGIRGRRSGPRDLCDRGDRPRRRALPPRRASASSTISARSRSARSTSSRTVGCIRAMRSRSGTAGSRSSRSSPASIRRRSCCTSRASSPRSRSCSRSRWGEGVPVGVAGLADALAQVGDDRARPRRRRLLYVARVAGHGRAAAVRPGGDRSLLPLRARPTWPSRYARRGRDGSRFHPPDVRALRRDPARRLRRSRAGSSPAGTRGGARSASPRSACRSCSCSRGSPRS